MGLDISLYSLERQQQYDKHDAEWNALWERKDRGEITEDQYDELRKTITPYPDSDSHPSEKYPDHLFNRRYLRSSYNDSGFNHAVPDFLATAGGEKYPEARGSLYWIFEPMGREWDGDDGRLTEVDMPLLRECGKRAQSVADELRSSDRLRVMTISANQLGGPDFLKIDDARALELVRERLADQTRASKIDDGEWWSSRDIHWFGGSLKVVAAIPGAEKQFFSDQPWPATHLVYQAQDDGFEFYVQSAEITAEFCDEAIALIERDGGAYISWSG